MLDLSALEVCLGDSIEPDVPKYGVYNTQVHLLINTILYCHCPSHLCNNADHVPIEAITALTGVASPRVPLPLEH